MVVVVVVVVVVVALCGGGGGKMHRGRFKKVNDTLEKRKKIKSLQHPVFPGGHPSKY